MNKYSDQQTTTLDSVVALNTNKVKPDLVILKYMAQQLYITLQQPDVRDTMMEEPLLYSLEDCHKRKQRISLYKPQALLRSHHLSFVGFVSGRQPALNASILNEIERIDELMVAELVNISGIFSYSSLEVRSGRWYNLVVFHDAETKVHLKSSTIHSYAAYQLAPQYYEWIRLHSGIMPGGLAQQELLLQNTKYYTFIEGRHRPDMYEITYGC